MLILATFSTDKKISSKDLLKRFAGPISQTLITGLRKELRTKILKDLKEQVKTTAKPIKKGLERICFINRFFLYHGLQKYYQSHPDQNDAVKRANVIIL